MKLLNDHHVEYLLIGGYAVGYYGHPRATKDIDIWIAVHPDNANRLVTVMHKFGFDTPEVTAELFLKTSNIVRMGFPPMRIELTSHIDGVEFNVCYAKRVVDEIDEVKVSLIALDDLKVNKRASGRPKDLDDLENLP
ncbi:MAG: hypothetical protein HZB52_00160 [Chloroflexi bacterium]|nr:hypothetical protein [Chloroflexota bacterium]